MSYWHAGVEIYYNEDNTEYTICGDLPEDEKC